jgi:hypothetical protein
VCWIEQCAACIATTLCVRALIGGTGDGLAYACNVMLRCPSVRIGKRSVIPTMRILLLFLFTSHTLFLSCVSYASVHSRQVSLRYNELGEMLRNNGCLVHCDFYVDKIFLWMFCPMGQGAAAAVLGWGEGISGVG